MDISRFSHSAFASMFPRDRKRIRGKTVVVLPETGLVHFSCSIHEEVASETIPPAFDSENKTITVATKNGILSASPVAKSDWSTPNFAIEPVACLSIFDELQVPREG